ncbi:RNA-binding protein 25-like [Macrobrachium nipponense]|uniref:RNA-binding protein 25-like n=1 Tax=Macrobrachium nipponense TaxID=159736 RepID=UPI0030C829D5
MELVDGKRTRKPVSYAVLDCSDDDDFSEFTPPVKKKKDGHDNLENSSSLSNKSDKDICNSSQESSSDHGKEKDREKRRDKERDEKRRDRDKDKRDRDRDRRDKDRDKHKKKDKHRDKDRSRESREKSSSEEERRKHKKDKKHDKKDKKREDKEKERINKAEDDDSDFKDSVSSPKSNSRDFKDSVSSPKSNSRIVTSTQISPGRASPKKRLTVEERMFQRELEAALAISKIEMSESADKQDLPGKEGEADIAGKNVSSGNSSDKEIHRSLDVNKLDSEDTKDISKEEKNEVQGVATDNTVCTGKEKADEENRTVTKEGNNMPERSASTVFEMEESEPSTSTGMTSKRQRKKVVFFEESDSESFDGFDTCEMSEESDFAPSPVKKNGRKAKETKKAKLPKSPKGLVKEQNMKSSPVKSPGRPRSTAKQSVKENTMPVVNGTSSPRVVSSTIAKPPEIKSPVGKVVIKSTPRTPEVKQERKTKTVSRINTPPTVVDASKVCTAKVPFRSPVQSSSTATPNFVPKSPNPMQRIGVRLGLSRTNFKPLHPKAIAK